MVWAEPVSQDIGAISQMSRRYGMPVLGARAVPTDLPAGGSNPVPA